MADASGNRVVLTWAALGMILAIGLALRLYRLSEESVCLEEYVSVSHLDAPDLAAFLKEVKGHYPYGAPLAYGICYVWTRVVGDSVARARLLCVLVGMSVVVLLFSYTRELYGRTVFARNAGLIAALCVALSPEHVFRSQEVRMYAFLTLFALLSTWSFLKALRDGRPRWWVLNVLANCCVLWTHLFGFLLVLSEAVFLLLFRWRERRKTVAWFAVHCLMGLPLAVWVMTIPRQPDVLYGYYGRPSVSQFFRDLIADDAIYLSRLYPPPSANAWKFLPLAVREEIFAVLPWFGGALVLVFLLSLLWLVWNAVRLYYRPAHCAASSPPSLRFEECVFLVIWLIVPLLALTALSWAWRPCYCNRFTIHHSLALYVGVGGAIASISRRGLRHLAVGLLVVLYAYQLSLALPGPTRTDWKSAQRHIKSTGLPEDLILIRESFWIPMFRFNAGDLPNPLSDAFTCETLCDETALFLEACAHGGAFERAVWALFVDMGPDEREAFEQCLGSHGLTSAASEFLGERNIRLYHVTRDTPGSPSRPAVPVDGLSMDPLAEALMEQQHHPAVAAFRDSVSLLPDSYGGAFARLGLALAEKAALAPAAASLRRAIEIDPRNAVTLLTLQATLVGIGDSRALDALFEVLPVTVENREALIPLFDACLERGDYDAVIVLARQALQRDCKWLRAYFYLASALEELGRRR